MLSSLPTPAKVRQGLCIAIVQPPSNSILGSWRVAQDLIHGILLPIDKKKLGESSSNFHQTDAFDSFIQVLLNSFLICYYFRLVNLFYSSCQLSHHLVYYMKSIKVVILEMAKVQHKMDKAKERAEKKAQVILTKTDWAETRHLKEVLKAANEKLALDKKKGSKWSRRRLPR